MPEDMPERISEDVRGRMPEDMPGCVPPMSEYMPDSELERMSEYEGRPEIVGRYA